MPETDPALCEFCGDHPREPGLPCCDNTFCRAAAQAAEREQP